MLRVLFDKLSSQRTGEPSAKVRERVERARVVQRERFKGVKLQTNSDSAQPPGGMGPAEIRQFCPLDQTSTSLLKADMQQMNLSTWAYHRTQSVKLAGANNCGFGGVTGYSNPHIAEAIQYRPRRQV